VSPRKAFLGAPRGVKIEFRIASSAPADVSVRIVGEGRELRRIELEDVPPGADQVESWDGLTDSGGPAPDGIYRILIGPPEGEVAAPTSVSTSPPAAGRRWPPPVRAWW
jgi:hypothetical protein